MYGIPSAHVMQTKATKVLYDAYSLLGWHAKTIIASLLQHNPKPLDLRGHWVKASLSDTLWTKDIGLLI